MSKGTVTKLGALLLFIFILPACSDDVSEQLDLGTDMGADMSTDGPAPDVGPGMEAGADVGLEAGADMGDGPVADLPPADMTPDMMPDMMPPDAGPCSLKVGSINGTPAASLTQLSSLDDKDSSTGGIQVNVEVSTVNIPAGTPVNLAVTNVATPYVANVSGGTATFTGVTVDSSLTTVSFTATSGTCAQDSISATVVPDPTCTISTPANGTTLYVKDDSTVGGSFTSNVVVTTTGGTGGTVDLTVNGVAATPSSSASATATTSFADTVLTSATGAKSVNALSATVKVPVGSGSLTATCTSSVTVDLSAVTCKLDAASFSPAPVAVSGTPAYALSSTSNTVTVTTDTAVNQVTLKINTGNPLLATPTAGQAVFNATLPTGIVTLQATCTNTSTGATNMSAVFSVSVINGPPSGVTDLACTITNRRAGQVTCTWKTAGPFVDSYELNLNPDTAITASTFGSATYKLTGTAAATGKDNIRALGKLPLGKTYYAAVKQVNTSNGASSISNLPAGVKPDYLKVTVAGSSSKGFLGQTLASGDFNCDGYSDLAAGEIGYSSDKGRVRIYWGSANGLVTTGFTNIIGSIANGKFGLSIAALNFDGDTGNCDDLAVHSWGADTKRGRVFIYLGKSTWTTRTDLGTGNGAELMYRIPIGAANTTYRLGWGLAATDMNGDGRGDLAMGYFNMATGGFAEVLVVYGVTGVVPMGPGIQPKDNKMPAGADLRIMGGEYANAFGQSNAQGGRLDSDIYHDLIISSPQETPPTYQGAVYVVKGAAGTAGVQQTVNIKTSSRAVRITGGASSFGFGFAAAGVGDINGDGKAEFAVSEPYAGGTTQVGKVYVFTLNGSSVPKTTSDAVIVVNNDNTYNTGNLAGRGLANGASLDPIKGADLNKDGRAELVFSSFVKNKNGGKWGQVYQFNGKAGPLTTPITWKLSEADYLWSDDTDRSTGYAITDIFLKDVNGDGFVDFAVGDSIYKPNIGRFELYY